MIIMDVFYNPNGIGDVLIVPLEEGNRYEITHESVGNVTKIANKQGSVIGYNIFQASDYFDLQTTGKTTMTEAILNQMKDLFHKNNIKDSLDFDLTPEFVVGYVTEIKQHEDADKLSVCKVDTGDEMLQIVCGAPNIDRNQKVVVAKTGATMPSGMKIKPTELRGVPSNGMICSQKELSLPDAPQEKGIYVLDDTYTTGEAFPF